MDELMVVGGGVSGLVAAIEAAERGWSVTVCEARSAVGGRARSMRGRFRANIGPHALYSDGAFWRWLEERNLLPPVLAALRPKTLFRVQDRLGAWPGKLGRPRDHVRPEAPVDESYRLWLGRCAGDEAAEAMIGLSFIGTYDHDPGRLSAAFVNELLRRLLSSGACYVVGGWSALVDRLTRRATKLGVRFHLRSRTRSLEQGPVIVATHLADARRLTGDPSASPVARPARNQGGRGPSSLLRVAAKNPLRLAPAVHSPSSPCTRHLPRSGAASLLTGRRERHPSCS